MKVLACEICDDAFGSGVICSPCRKKPANRAWIASLNAEQSTPVRQHWVVTPIEKQIARELLYGDGSIRGAARVVGCTPEKVRVFLSRLLADEDTRRTRRRRTDGTMSDPIPACAGHIWIPRSDVGLAMYCCTACGWFGRRDVVTGAIAPTTIEPAGARPAPTVASKQKWSNDDRKRLAKTLPIDRQEGDSR